MNKKAIITTALGALSAVLTAGGTTSTGRLEDPRVVIDQIEEQSLQREQEVAESLDEGGPFMQANNQTSQVLKAILEDDLEQASRMILEGKEKGYDRLFANQASFFEEQVEAAAGDSSRAIRHLGQRPQVDEDNRMTELTQFPEGAGPAPSADVERLRERMEGLNNDVNAYGQMLLAYLPELGPELSDEWDPNQLVEIAMASQLESLQYAYYARISRMNALLWEKFPVIVKRRALEGATGGRPRSTEEVISRGERLKIALPTSTPNPN